MNLEYFYSRLIFTDTENLSVLVFLSGWERALLNIYNTYGLGVGFNQLGYIGSLGHSNEIMTKLGMSNLNLYDGGTTASKIISELGIFGLSLVIIYIFFLLKFYFIVKQNLSHLDIKDIYFFSCYMMFTIELFIRGVGLFSPTIFLFVVSIVYISKISYPKIKKLS